MIQKIQEKHGGTSYEELNILTILFMDYFKQAIIDTRMSDNMDLLYDTVGRDNFEELNQTVTEYRNLPYLKMMSQVINHEDTDLTRKRQELIEKGKTIAEQMKQYQREHYSITEESINKGTINEPNENKDKAKSILANIISEERIR